MVVVLGYLEALFLPVVAHVEALSVSFEYQCEEVVEDKKPLNLQLLATFRGTVAVGDEEVIPRVTPKNTLKS